MLKYSDVFFLFFLEFQRSHVNEIFVTHTRKRMKSHFWTVQMLATLCTCLFPVEGQTRFLVICPIYIGKFSIHDEFKPTC